MVVAVISVHFVRIYQKVATNITFHPVKSIAEERSPKISHLSPDRPVLVKYKIIAV